MSRPGIHSDTSIPVDSLFDGDRPRWEAITFDAHCARCEYNLRGLSRPTCPECGLEFDWCVVLDRARHRSELCFEYGWRTHPVRSLFVTLGWCFRPRVLWRRVTIHDPVQPRPLWVFLLASTVVSFLLLHLGGWAISRGMVQFNALLGGRANVNFTRELSRASYQIDRLSTWPLIGDPRYLYLPIGFLMSVMAALLLLRGLHQTLHRYRIRQAQVLRVVAYCTAPFGAICCAALWFLAVVLPFQVFRGPVPILPQERLFFLAPTPRMWGATSKITLGTSDYIAIGAAGLAGLLLFSYWLARALQLHLKIERPWTIALLTSFVSMLFSYSILLAAGMWISGMWS